jgi:sugar phosphate isomerase/epimerase
MKFAYSTNAFIKFSLFEAVEKIASLGFGGVEIMGDRPHLYPPDWAHDTRARLKDLIRRLGLRITNLNSFTLFAVGDMYLPSWIEAEKERREIRVEHTLESLRAASFLGCPNISVPPGGPLQGMDRQEALSLFYRGLEKVIPLAEELGVKILVEPEPGLLLENSGQFKEFIRGVGSPSVRLNFDLGHFFCVGEDPCRSFEELLPWVGHVHIEDIGADRRHHHLIPGQGAMDLPRALRTFRQCGYSGDISLELYTYPDQPVEAGQKSLDYLLPLLQGEGYDLKAMMGAFSREALFRPNP